MDVSEVIRRDRIAETLVDAARGHVVLLLAPAGFGKSAALRDAAKRARQVGYATVVTAVRALPSADDLVHEANTLLIADDIDSFEQAGSGDLLRALADLHDAGVDVICASSKRTEPVELVCLYDSTKLFDETFLRFTFEETKSLLKLTHADVSDETAQELYRFAEGWPYGISHLADAAQRHAGEPLLTSGRAFDSMFRLMVAPALTEEELSFLKRVSLLHELDAAACDFILERQGSERMLDKIAARVLFVRRKDDIDNSYELMWPFREWLLSQLFADEDREDINHLCERATDWADGKGDAFCSALFRLMTCDVVFIEALAQDLVGHSRISSLPLEQWACRIDPALAPESAVLNALFAWTFICCGLPDEAAVWMDRCEQLLRSTGALSPLSEAGFAIAHAKILSLSGKHRSAIDAAERILQSLEANESLAYLCLLEHMLGESYEALDELDVSKSHYMKSESYAEMGQFRGVVMFSRYERAGIYWRQNHLKLAESTCRKALEEAPDDQSIVGLTLSRIASVCIAQNDQRSACELLESARIRVRASRNVDFVMEIENVRAWQLAVSGDLDLAYETAVKNGRLARGFARVPRGTLVAVHLMQAKIAIACNLLDEARSALQLVEVSIDPGDSVNEIRTQLIRSRLALAEQRAAEAVHILVPALERLSGQPSGSLGIEALILQARALHAMGSDAAAALSFNDALEQGSRYGIYDVFLFDIASIRKLLCESISVRKLSRGARGFAKVLVDNALADVPKSAAAVGPTKRGRLTQREQSVLDLLNKGMTRSEIAEELGIAVNTARAHIAHIYAKLEVDNKLDAFHESINLE